MSVWVVSVCVYTCAPMLGVIFYCYPLYVLRQDHSLKLKPLLTQLDSLVLQLCASVPGLYTGAEDLNLCLIGKHRNN